MKRSTWLVPQQRTTPPAREVAEAAQQYMDAIDWYMLHPPGKGQGPHRRDALEVVRETREHLCALIATATGEPVQYPFGFGAGGSLQRWREEQGRT